MNPSEDEYSSLVFKILTELSAANPGARDRVIAETVIKLGRNSKNVQEFNASLSQYALSFHDSFAASLLNSIHQFFSRRIGESCNAGGDSEEEEEEQESIRLEVVGEEPEFLRRQRNRSDEVFPSKNQDSPLYRAAANHCGLIEKHRSELGDEPELAPTDHSAPPRSLETVRAQRLRLPIAKLIQDIISSVSESREIVIVGESGSGKTTQIPQYLAIARKKPQTMLYCPNPGLRRRIGCTQPSELAAIAAARRVAEEAGYPVGGPVGYKIRSEDQTGPKTVIKFMTENVLWDEITADPKLSDYWMIMIDEAHERSITTDVVLGLIKNAIRLGEGFRLVISSATREGAEPLANYFFGCKILEIPSHRPLLSAQVMSARQPCSDPLMTALKIVLDIHTKEPLGDILLFLSGQDEAEFACRFLAHRASLFLPGLLNLVIFPAWRFLRGEIDPGVFKPAPAGARKVVVSTAAAEASLAAINGILYVVDIGLMERRVVDRRQAMDAIFLAPISVASVQRRTALAERTERKGTCFRLYTEAALRDEMSPVVEPEIRTANLGAVALQMIASGITDIWNFEFVDRPPTRHVAAALRQLYFLGALNEEGVLTDLGRTMALFPLDPPWSRALVAGVYSGCGEEVLTVIALAQAGRIFFWPRENQAEADRRHHGFFRAEGDHLSLLDVYESWRSNECSSEWCLENFVQLQSLIRANNLRNHFVLILNNHGIWNAGYEMSQNATKIRKAITSGLFFHAAWEDPRQGCYKTVVKNHRVYIHPQSALYHQQPSWVIYDRLVKAKDKDYMFGVMAIDPIWLAELAPRFFKAHRILHRAS